MCASQTPRNVPFRSRSGMMCTPADRPQPLGVEPQDRDQRHLQRHDEQPDDEHEQHVPAAELHPRERVGGERGDGDRDHRRRDRHREAVEERVREAAGVERAADSSRASTRRPGTDGRTPSTIRSCRRALGPERRDEHADGRDQPDEDDDEDRDADEPAALAGRRPALLLRGASSAARRRRDLGRSGRRGERSSDLLLLAELPDVPHHHRDDRDEQHDRDRRAAAVIVR